MRGVSVEGTLSSTSQRDAILPPVAPVRHIMVMPFSFAISMAFRILGEFPEVLRATSTSPGRPAA